MYQLYNNDCLEVMKTLPDKSIDCIICDLPYGTTKCSWDVVIPFEDMWKELKRLRKDETPIILFGVEPFASYLRISNIKEFKYDWVWRKSKSGSAFTAKYRPVNKHEMICVFGKGKVTYNPQMEVGQPYTRTHKISECDINNHGMGFNKREIVSVNEGYRYPITVQEFQQKWRRQDQVHPTQKPVELLEYLVKTYSNEGDTILDFTMGSGSTGVACLRTKRKFVGIEKDENYFQIAKERIENESKKLFC